MIINVVNAQNSIRNNSRQPGKNASRELQVNANNQLQLAGDELKRLGITPGAKVYMKVTQDGIIIQKADPSLARIYVEPTNACNLNCRTCVRNSWDEPEGFMDMDNYRNLIEGLNKVDSLQTISFWGFGEPLLHPRIVEMVSLAKSLGAQTQLITNALPLDKEKAEGLVKAGLDTIVISVDGASPQAYADIRPQGDLYLLQQNINGLRHFRRKSPERNPEIGIEFVVMKRNMNELRYLGQLAHSLGATFIFLTNLLPYTEELKDEILYWFSTSRSSSAKPSKWKPAIFLPPMDLHPKHLEPVAKLTGYTGSICTPQGQPNDEGYCSFVNEGSAVVSWDGEVSPCIALMHSYTCYVMEREKKFLRCTLGNIGKEDIKDIWHKKEFINLRKLVQEFPFPPCTECGGCDLSETNEEDCFGNTFPVCGDCLWAKGVIQCP